MIFAFFTIRLIRLIGYRIVRSPGQATRDSVCREIPYLVVPGGGLLTCAVLIIISSSSDMVPTIAVMDE